MKRYLAFIGGLLLFCSPVFSQSYDLLNRAEAGDTGAQMMLGVMFSSGTGVPKDDEESVKWFRLAANQGHARAQLSLGMMHAQGQGTPQDNVKAYLWTSMAAAQGEEDALEARDLIGGQLDADTRDRAQQLATRCFDSGFKQCE